MSQAGPIRAAWLLVGHAHHLMERTENERLSGGSGAQLALAALAAPSAASFLPAVALLDADCVRRWERKFGHTLCCPAPWHVLHLRRTIDRPDPLQALHGAQIKREPQSGQESLALPLRGVGILLP
jgi:hypothetical protein